MSPSSLTQMSDSCQVLSARPDLPQLLCPHTPAFQREIEGQCFSACPFHCGGQDSTGLSPAATRPPRNQDLVSSCQGPSLLGVGVESNLFSSSQILASAMPKPAIFLFY